MTSTINFFTMVPSSFYSLLCRLEQALALCPVVPHFEQVTTRGAFPFRLVVSSSLIVAAQAVENRWPQRSSPHG